ncbi:MAG: hypothetical protein IJ629_05705 [Clostridia bacterium]|nr:hypothetical protein [Clostridia bacterium]
MPEKTKNKVLIEIGAQHPLVDGKPGIEFEKRLLKGIELYHQELEKGNDPIIYIPGSLHSIQKNGEWITDKNSLSTAGKNFLLEHGIPEERIRADETNEKYKTDGVYNSGDECLVAKSIADDEGISRIISVVSPIQIDRKALFYIRYGYFPEMYGVGLENTYHNYPGEAFWSLYITYFIDPTWQDSFLAAKTRQERDISYKVTREIQELIDAGINIPDIVKQRKEEMLSLYKKAQENMKANSENKGIMIGIDISEEDDEKVKAQKIEEVLSLCEQYQEQKEHITICVQGKVTSEVIAILKQKLGEEVSIEGVDGFESEIERYQTIKAAKWFHVTDSPRVMNEAMIAIQKGALPIMFAIPNEKISYIDQIEELYTEILRVKERTTEEREAEETGDEEK